MKANRTERSARTLARISGDVGSNGKRRRRDDRFRGSVFERTLEVACRRDAAHTRGEESIAIATLLIATTASLVAVGIEYYVFAIAYPSLRALDARTFRAAHALHCDRIAYAIGPALLGAFGANAVLVVVRPHAVPFVLPIVAALAGALVLAYTAFVAVPLHARLGDGPDARIFEALNATEKYRAAATLLAGACDVAMVWYALATP